MTELIKKYSLMNDSQSIILVRSEDDSKWTKIHLHTSEGNQALGNLIRSISSQMDEMIIPTGISAIPYDNIKLLIEILETELISRYRYYIGRSKRHIYTIINDLNEYREQCDIIGRLEVDI